ncbi:hypothetical protein E1B28_012157 [Marasmius oreades]|uniref:Methyltransferase n=1 Tax=Marasmius oreades TaxID=181124 RepID=A0A9P7RQZ6_9AGAR|nr:uncharacterized protein E1B28_012157 [Marasmius oreades]KAG7088134.1 hypothetical protein E1B28_012157 [Marasmius oreades]
MSTATTIIAPSTTVSAVLTHFSPPQDGSLPYTCVNESADRPRQNWVPQEHNVDIEDVRTNGTEKDYTLDKNGFQFYREAAKHTSFLTDEEVEKEYYPESIELIKKLTGARKVVLFDHTIRRRRPGELDTDVTKRQPVALVHVDQTPESAANRVRRHLPADEAEEILRSKSRFQILNLWRPIANPALDWPLALCDYSTVDKKKDLVPVALIYPDREGQTFGVRFSENYRWKYAKGMTPEDVVLIKCYDSIEDGSVAQFTPHTAFQDPTTPEGAPLRQSIELRALVFY